MKRRLLALLPVPLLVALAAWTSARVADRAGATAARALSVMALLVREPSAAEAPTEDATVPTEISAEAEPLAAPPAKGKKHGQRGAKAGPPAVFVSRDRVLNLANSGARPRGIPVAASAGRPAGLKLLGVAALGIGLRDGDVLTQAVGQPALSSSAVVQAVLRARARHTAVLDGEFWRGQERWLIRVEQPYLPERHAEGDEASGPRLTMR